MSTSSSLLHISFVAGSHRRSTNHIHINTIGNSNSFNNNNNNSSGGNSNNNNSNSSRGYSTVRYSTVTHRFVGPVARSSRHHRKLAGSLRRMGDELYLRRLPLSVLAAVFFTKFLPKSIRRTLMRWWKS